VAAPINIPAYSDALVVLATAGVVVPLVRRWGISPVLGYLGAGALLGPLGLGSFIDKVPLLYWLTVVDANNVAGIANLGVVFLLFLIGIELSYERLAAMRRLVFGMGGLQIVLSTLAIAGVLLPVGLQAPVAIMLAACLALSSTAIVLEVLSNQGRINTGTGRAAFAVLLAQDLAVVPILMLVSILGANSGGSIWSTIGTALLQATAAIAIIALVGRAMLRPLFRLVASTRSNELFIAAILFVIVATGIIAAVANLSMSLGAFVAGLLLAETEYRKAIEATVEPFKGLLLGIFFFTVGMNIDVRELARDPLWLLACVVGLIGLKAILLIGIARLFKLSWAKAVEIGLLLGPGGEFAFVGIGLAASLGVVDTRTSSFALAVTSLTMVLIPVLAQIARRLQPMLETPKPVDPQLVVVPAPHVKHAIVVGCGRVGRVVCEMLKSHGVPYTAVDLDPGLVSKHRREGIEIYFGDATRPDFLKACGIMDAAGVIITVQSRVVIETVVAEVLKLRPDILIISRARDAEQARLLYAAGVTDAVPETIEASLQLSEAALVALGKPAGPVIASIHEKRDEFRRELQEAAQEAGLSTTRSIRAKGT
jgi:CPA2 family monovalent cation:H+ antiporter-2